MVESREEDTSLQTLLRHVESPFVVRGREGREGEEGCSDLIFIFLF